MLCRTWGSALMLVAVAGLCAADAAAQGRQRTMRFGAMDRNNDGVITRQEWRGNDQSFRNHDWNGDGVLSGDEVRPGAERRVAKERDELDDFDSPDREYELRDWTAANFRNIDHNKDNRITRDEWHFDREGFRRADHNRDGVISRTEFLGGGDEDDDREDRFRVLDENGDGRIARGEWHGSVRQFNALDDNRDGFISRAEAVGSDEPPPDLFTSVDVNGDGAITRDEWHWSRASFDQRDANRDGRLARDEFTGNAAQPQRSAAYRAGFDRGMTEGRAAGREDRERKQGWDLEGQRELETADSGYEPRVGPRADYQAGYRDGFRRGYKEGWGK
jgi:Ca2+-binding EF-hand superfamily protein